MQTVTTLEMLRNALARLREGGASLALVPTMGALHEGHLALVREARKHADRVVASIFVNPTQFGPGEDLDAYPRQLAQDQALLEAEGVALLWAPDASQMYPQGFATKVSVEDLARDFCGAARPGHFDGVATVVCKLFNQVQPDYAVFGEKDWQQLSIIRAMARDLDLVRPHHRRIIAVPTVREADGLAMSSRNRYLSSAQRAIASALPRAMAQAKRVIEEGGDVQNALDALQAELLSAGFDAVDYAALADAETLARLDRLAEVPARLLIAARLGAARLIDNIAVGKIAMN